MMLSRHRRPALQGAPVSWSCRAALLSCGLIALAAVGCGHSRPATLGTITQVPSGAPRYVPLNVPTSQVTVPAMFVGEQGALSSGCFRAPDPGDVHDDAAMDQLAEEYSKSADMQAGLKASLSKYLTLGLDSSLASKLVQKVDIKLEGGIKLHQIDPAKIMPELASEGCTEVELDWFQNNRRVVSGLLVAGTVTVESGLDLTSEQKAALDTAIEKLGADLSLTLQRGDVSGETFHFTGHDLAIGALTTSLVAEQCEAEWSAKPDETYEICGGAYEVSVSPSATGTAVTVNVSSGLTASGQYDLPYNLRKAYALGAHRIASALVTKDLKVSFKGLFVGTSGKE